MAPSRSSANARRSRSGRADRGQRTQADGQANPAARADDCKTRSTTMAPRTAAPAAIAIQRHGREAAGVATAGGAAGATAGGAGTEGGGGGEGGGVAAAAGAGGGPQE